ncbi:DUF4149 domain-containing protein [sulfur-oxidizing endosymbiont of Gigantopelta aegis]|uniref:DUF4149 domain-containing protein n=1 Tax=sulfur-oxidizing endosymbiont of Gigantopelta aegis TaxID=2794934 RepID=UPI0018DE7504|nr:DUF4149 domain-containing protein [sulfur-oxidizing endosymbiont of Gigantopelta aegis]
MSQKPATLNNFSKQYLNQTSGETILLTLWIGGLWIVGFLVTPTLFGNLDDRQLAGMLAGKMFTVISYIGLFCGSVLLLTEWRRAEVIKRSFNFWLLVAMLFLVLVGEFVIQPQMAALKLAGLATGAEFSRLHGIASALYMLNCLLGLVLILRQR